MIYSALSPVAATFRVVTAVRAASAGWARTEACGTAGFTSFNGTTRVTRSGNRGTVCVCSQQRVIQSDAYHGSIGSDGGKSRTG